jgi:hypothetical protein
MPREGLAGGLPWTTCDRRFEEPVDSSLRVIEVCPRLDSSPEAAIESDVYASVHVLVDDPAHLAGRGDQRYR